MSDEPDQTRVDRLTKLRDAQAEALLSGIPAREFAALSREYRATLAEIADLTPAEPKGDAIDQLAQRRTARGAGTAKSRRNASADQG